jgi:hypothetical protein
MPYHKLYLGSKVGFKPIKDLKIVLSLIVGSFVNTNACIAALLLASKAVL